MNRPIKETCCIRWAPHWWEGICVVLECGEHLSIGLDIATGTSKGKRPGDVSNLWYLMGKAGRCENDNIGGCWQGGTDRWWCREDGKKMNWCYKERCRTSRCRWWWWHRTSWDVSDICYLMGRVGRCQNDDIGGCWWRRMTDWCREDGKRTNWCGWQWRQRTNWSGGASDDKAL